MYDYDDDAPRFEYEHQAIDAYRDMLDEVYPPVRIGECDYDPSRVLESVDPIAFRCGFVDWLDSEGIDSDTLK